MTSVCIYLQVHQPHRIKPYRIFNIGNDHEYFNDRSDTDLNNERVMRKVVEKSYLPTAHVLLQLLEDYPEFCFALSISGVALDQFEAFAPEVLEAFKDMARTGRVEFLSETYYHSLGFFYSQDEFEEQVAMHGDRIIELFDVVPTVFRNTELAYTNDLAVWADRKGYKGILAEGWDDVLQWRSPNFVYKPKHAQNIRLLLKNYRLSDDIAFRFSERSWEGWPLTADTFGHWVSSINGTGETVNLFMDYETFGEHQWDDTGIFNFLGALPEVILKHPDNNFKTPSGVIDTYKIRGDIDVPHVLTWADTERDLSAWMGNGMQNAALNMLYELEHEVKKQGDEKLLEDWRRLQTSDHFYYMCTKWSADGDVHAYFNPYESPYDAYITYMNVLKDIRLRLGAREDSTHKEIVHT